MGNLLGVPKMKEMSPGDKELRMTLASGEPTMIHVEPVGRDLRHTAA
jgi:hypothetical protein